MSTNLPREKQRPVVITGAAGLIGSRLAKSLVPDYPVIGLDVTTPQDELPAVDWVACDLTEDDSVEKAFSEIRDRHGERLASVIHLASYYDFSGEPSTLYDELTVKGTHRLLRNLKSLDVEQFVFSSTMLVLRPTSPGHMLTENSPIETEWDYPESKLAAEQVIAATRENIPAVILRIAGVYDEGCHCIPLAQQIRRIYESQVQSHYFPGHLDHGQSFVHLEDLVDCFQRVIRLRADLDRCSMFLIGESDVVSYGEIQDIVARELYGEEWSTHEIPKAVAKAGLAAKKTIDQEAFIKPWMIDHADAHYAIDNSKAKQVLRWHPRHALRRTLPEMVHRLKEDPQRWYERNDLEFSDQLIR